MTVAAGVERAIREPVPPQALRLPQAGRGQRIGLFGGSFNPAHAGHRLVAETALRRLKLDRIWWIVSPGNPLKDHGALAPLGERIAGAKEIASDPRMDVTAFEAAGNMRYTADTLAFVQARRRGVSFVWIMGADSLASFHLWQDWRRIARTVPIAVIDRPGSTLAFLSSPMAKTFERSRIAEDDAQALAGRPAPAWVFLHGPRSPASSTALRARLAAGETAAGDQT